MQSDSIAAIAGALAKAQKAYKPVKRTEHVGYSTTAGPKSYNYAPLDEVIDATKEALSLNGLAITQLTRRDEQDIILDTFLIHSSGEWLSSELFVGSIVLSPQAFGSALTYMRRYSLSAILGIASEEDDDAIEAEKTKTPSTSRPATPPPPASRQPPSEHWCKIHNTKFFKSGQMPRFAHPLIVDGKQVGWCDEKAAEKELFPEPAPQPPPAESEGIASQTGVAEQKEPPATTLPNGLNMADVKQALEDLQWADVRKHLSMTYRLAVDKDLEVMLRKLTREQAVEFCKTLAERKELK